MERLTGNVLVDTNVMVKLAFDEPDSDKAHAVIERSRSGPLNLVALDFLFLECANVAWTKTMRKLVTPEEAQLRLEDISVLSRELNVLPARRFVEKALGIAQLLRHAVYDTVLLAAAQANGIPLLTADEQLYRTASAFPAHVILLSELRV